MKTLRFAAWLMSAAVLAGGLSACNDDDENDGGGLTVSDDDDADNDGGGNGNGGNSGISGKMEWVDMGLSVRWASYNLGANKPWEYGDYYAWGETETKKSYDEGNSATNDKDLETLRKEGYIDSNGNIPVVTHSAK